MLRSAISDRLKGGKPSRSSKEPPLNAWLGQDDDALVVALPHAERVRALAEHDSSGSVVFQSTAVGALQVLRRVAAAERAAADAAISLAQQQKLEDMISGLEATAAALQDTLSTQGRQMLGLCDDSRASARPAEERSWWFALSEAVEALEEGTAWMATVVSGQPKGCAARTLSSIIARQLRRHHQELLSEAEAWIT